MGVECTDMDKIPIKKVSAGCHKQKGFDSRGCLGTNCGDACCRYGADFDQESANIVFQNRKKVERLIKNKLEKCYLKVTLNDPEFLGGNARRSRVRDGFCVFHNPHGKGCVLFVLATRGEIPIRAVPSICRLYPLTWGNGRIIVYDQIEKGCNTVIRSNKTKDSAFQTQKKAIEDIFSLGSRV